LNLREGTRRLALLLGVVGAILGGFASYVELQTTLAQRTRHNRFEQLAASEVVQHERKCRQAGILSGCPDNISDLVFAPIQKPQRTFQIDPKTGERIQAAPDFIPDTSQKHGPWEKYADKGTSGAVLDMSKSIPIPSVVMKNGIKAVNWNHDYGVESIETEDGQTLYSTLAPSAWLYLLIVLFPVLGFFIPWGTIRALGWVGAGFVQPAK
jgi:hypothetical protein